MIVTYHVLDKDFKKRDAAMEHARNISPEYNAIEVICRTVECGVTRNDRCALFVDGEEVD